MQSKIESISFLKEQVRSQRWYLVVVTLVLFVMGPANTLRKLGYDHKFLEERYFLARYSRMYIQEGGMLSSETYMFMLVSLLAGVLISVMSYSYLHYHNQVSFYYSVPMKRTHIFDCKAIASFLSFCIPMIIMMLLNIVVLFSQGILTKYNAVGILIVIFLNLISFALGYYIAAISMLLTGRVLIGVLGTGVFIGYFPIVVSVITGYCSMFFNSYVGSGTVPNNSWRYIFNLSPVGLFSSFEWDSVLCYMASIFGVIVLMAVARYLVIIRPSEAAEKPMAYKKVADVIKVAISIPVGLSLGLFLAGTTSQPTAWFYLGILFGVIVMYVLMQLFYSVELKKIFQQKIQIIVTIVVTLAIGSIFFFDILGYDTYIPDYDNISEINVCFSDVYGYSFVYMEGKEDFNMGKNEEMYLFVQDVVASSESCSDSDDYTDTTFINIDYKLNNGTVISRAYQACVDDIEESAEVLWENDVFLDLNYSIRNLEVEIVSYIYFTSQYLESQQIDFGTNKIENTEFLLALQQDYMEMDGLDIMKETPLASISYEILEDDLAYNYGSVDIYPNCTNAISYLQSKGIDLTEEIQASDVKELYIVESTSVLNSIYEYGSVASAIEAGYEIKVVADQDEISEELPKLVDYYLVNLFQDTVDDKCVGIEWKDDESGATGYYYYMD